MLLDHAVLKHGLPLYLQLKHKCIAVGSADFCLHRQPIHVSLTGNTNKKVEEKVVEQMQRKKPLLRSMSASSLHGSPSSKLSRQVSSMSRKVKDTLGKVISGNPYSYH